MTGIYGTSQEDKIRERELEAYTNTLDCDDEQPEKVIEQHDYNFPSYLNINANFVQLVKFMDYQQLSKLVWHVAIIADEKNDIDTRHWASDELNAFLNGLLNRGE